MQIDSVEKNEFKITDLKERCIALFLFLFLTEEWLLPFLP